MTLTTKLSGYRGTRGDVLVAVKRSQPVTAKSLAAALHVTANGLRRHLKELETEGVVEYRRVVQGVGGPAFAYSLTERGEGLFPRAYDEALGEALELVRGQLGTEGVATFFRRRWEQVVETVRGDLVALPLAERSRRLADLLTGLGYMAEVAADETATGTATLREHNCTLRHLVERFPEVCAAEQGFIAEVLGAEVTRQAHMATGANCCEYCIAESAPVRIEGVGGAREPAPATPPALQETS